MVALVRPEKSVTERLQIVLAAIDGLQEIEVERGLNRVQQAALEFLESVYFRALRHRGAYISQELIAQPLAVARRAMEVRPCR